MTRVATLILAFGFLANAAEPTKPLEVSTIQKLAKEANSAAEHLKVSDHWQDRATRYEALATKYDRDAEELVRRNANSAMRHKWPAMAQGPIDLMRSKAMEARRAANESRELVTLHRNLAKQLAVGE